MSLLEDTLDNRNMERNSEHTIGDMTAYSYFLNHTELDG